MNKFDEINLKQHRIEIWDKYGIVIDNLDFLDDLNQTDFFNNFNMRGVFK